MEMTAQQNIARLPKWCYGVLLTDKSLIIIKAGEIGYRPVKTYSSLNEAFALFDVKNTDELANKLNREMGVTLRERKAMEWGSQFGWDHKLSMPEAYDDEGKPSLHLTAKINLTDVKTLINKHKQ
jgi:hypothetical protein